MPKGKGAEPSAMVRIGADMSYNSICAAAGRRLGVKYDARAVAALASQAATASAIAASHRPLTFQPAPEHWFPVEPSRSTRNIAVRSKESFRISVVDVRSQEIRLESLLETWLVLVLMSLPGVIDVIEQPDHVWYRGIDGKRRRHWFDCIAVLSDGRRIAYVVKCKAASERKGMRAFVDRLAPQVDPKVADAVQLVDEDWFPLDRVHNARLIHSVRLHGPRRGDDVVTAVEAVMRGPMLLDEAVRRAGHGGEGFRAIVRLIADGTLRVVEDGRIDYGSYVEPVLQTPGGLQ